MNKAIERKQHLVAYGFVLPFFVVFAAMLIAPLVYSGYLSFFVDRLVGGVSFVGFGNYVRAFQDPAFLFVGLIDQNRRDVRDPGHPERDALPGEG